MVSPCSTCQASGAAYLSRAGEPLCDACFSSGELAAAVAREGDARTASSRGAAILGLESLALLGLAPLLFPASPPAGVAVLLLGLAIGTGALWLEREARRPST